MQRQGVRVRKNVETKKDKVFIVALNPKCLEPTILSLQRYDLEIFVYQSISEVVERLFEEMPVCIFVSSESASEDMLSMELLKMQSEISIVGYAEKSLVSSVVKLGQFNFKYAICPPLSGAAAYRVIKKVMTDYKLLTS